VARASKVETLGSMKRPRASTNFKDETLERFSRHTESLETLDERLEHVESAVRDYPSRG